MADIAKCNDSLCPSKDYCYRFTAIAGMYQSYAEFNRDTDEYNCNDFWPNCKCRYCGLENGVHKMGCETRKIQINL
jgi:hypothetical protein